MLAEDRENADLSQLMPVELKVEKAAEAGAGEATGTGPNRWNFRFWKRRPARRKIQTESIVHMPDGTTQSASRMWIRNNGTGTWHGYPMP